MKNKKKHSEEDYDAVNRLNHLMCNLQNNLKNQSCLQLNDHIDDKIFDILALKLATRINHEYI